MFEAAGKAFVQMFSPPFRRVLLKTIGLTLLLMVAIGIGLHRAFAALAAEGANWTTGVNWGTEWGWHIFIWFVSFAAGLGIFAGAIFLMPAIAALVGSFFVDEIAEAVERRHYPNDPPGHELALWRALIEGLRAALLAIVVYLCAAPLLLFVGLGFIVMFVANSYLLGREYFLLAAMRFRTPAEARALYRAHRASVILSGMLIAFVVSIPVLNFITPLFAMAYMVHIHKRMSVRGVSMIAQWS
jgi:CysZ protein